MTQTEADREKLARAIHESYRENNAGEKPEDDPSMAPWERLLEDLRESNRLQADHIQVKLRAIGCGFASATGEGPVLMEFTDGEIEVMAMIEHDRFVSERSNRGWSLGPRDPEKKTTPYLVAYKDLAEEIKELDRQAVRQIPRLLATAGFEMHRLG
jgi:hypothetical protein